MLGLRTIEPPYSWLELLFKVNTESAPLRFGASVAPLTMGSGELCLALLGSTQNNLINVLNGELARHLRSLWLELPCMVIQCKNHTAAREKYTLLQVSSLVVEFTFQMLRHQNQTKRAKKETLPPTPQTDLSYGFSEFKEARTVTQKHPASNSPPQIMNMSNKFSVYNAGCTGD